MTTGSIDEARRIGKDLVERRLAACINIIGPMTSIFRWEGRLQEEQETVLIAKTTEARLAQLMDRVKATHSFDCPCIVSLPVENGNPAFLEWVAAEVDADPPDVG
jgi:periplasmic divalent cation tolerance protein